MRRFLTLVALLVAGPAPARPDPEPKGGRVTIRLDVSPAGPPVPASRFNVYPEYRDRQPGSRVQGLLRCFAEMDSFYNREQTDLRQKLTDTPMADLPADSREQALVKRGLAYPDDFRNQIANIDSSARYDRIEWNEWFDLRRDGVYWIIPEVQKLRYLAQVVVVRMRGEVKAGEWDKAVASAKTLFGMAQALEQHPTLIGNLVGVALAHLAVNCLEEMAGQPGAPSLFWALADLPAPVVSTRAGVAGERMFLVGQFRQLTEARRPLTADELTRLLKSVGETVRTIEESSKDKPVPNAERAAADPAAWFGRRANDPAWMAAARRRAVEAGYPEATVAALPPVQLGLLDELHGFERVRDELFKAYNLPFPQADPAMRAASEAAKGRDADLVLPGLLLPAVFRTKRVETRLTMRAGQLRVLEAVRLHAHDTGRLPATLDEIKLPLPANPFTGQPYRYELKDGVATIGADYTAEGDRQNRVYEVRLRK